MKCPYRLYTTKETESENFTVKIHQYLEDCYESVCPFYYKDSLGDKKCLRAKNEVSNEKAK